MSAAEFDESGARESFWVLVRDSVTYFFMLSIIYSSTVIAWVIKDLNDYIEITTDITTAITGVLGSRMILNLRHAGTLGSGSTELTGPSTQERIQFAHGETVKSSVW
ncbi:hypothetical protein CPC08DRAFT_729492 [Agrocybe pediades]|nr:hypothetical protein CPC08DRAFT_729492 [Agrocybe pediades]